MNLALARVAEELATEFAELRSSTVVAVVAVCAHGMPGAEPPVVEQAARARLRMVGKQQARRRGRTATRRTNICSIDA